MLVLQAYYDIKKEKQKNQTNRKPDLSLLRRILFWDTDIDKLDWEKQYSFIIKRIFERGNEDEKKEILKFYGKLKILEVTGSAEITGNYIPVMHYQNRK